MPFPVDHGTLVHADNSVQVVSRVHRLVVLSARSEYLLLSRNTREEVHRKRTLLRPLKIFRKGFLCLEMMVSVSLDDVLREEFLFLERFLGKIHYSVRYLPNWMR